MSQWEYLLKNLGCWHGSFTRLSPQGEIRSDIKSEVSLEGLEENKTIRQTIRLFEDEQPQEKVLEYSSLNRSVLFFENGAFSQGSMQLGPNAEFGAELGLIDGDRRMRLVQLYDKAGNLEGFTLIREHLPNTTPLEQADLKITDLLGTWHGEAITIYPDLKSLDRFTTQSKWQQEGDRVTMTLQTGNPSTNLGANLNSTITSVAQLQGNVLRFINSPQNIQTLFLPSGTSVTCPLQVKARQSLRLAVSWLVKPNLHQRMIRSYDSKGGWSNLTLVTEKKVDG